MADRTAQATDIFKFVFQKNDRKPVHVYTIREDEVDKIYGFCKRLAEVDSLTALKFAEITNVYDNASMAWLWGSPNKPWPNTKVIHHDGIIARKRAMSHITTHRRTVAPTINRSNRNLPAIIPPVAAGLLSKELADTNVAFTLPLKIKVA